MNVMPNDVYRKDRLMNGQTGRQTLRQTDGQTGRHDSRHDSRHESSLASEHTDR